VTITPSLPGPQSPGTAVVFTAAGQGSIGYQYRFWLYDGTSWTMKQDYGAGSSWTMTATTAAGSYTIAVDVRTTTGVYRDAVGYLPYQLANSGPATGVIITPSLPSPQSPGTVVEFTAAGQGSSGYQYRFWFYDGATWTMVQDYGIGSTWSMPTATPAGYYTIGVDVRTTTGVYRDTVGYLPYQLSQPATGVTITPSLSSPRPAGTAVVFTAAGEGSSGYQYRFWLYNGIAWAMVQDYGVGSTWTLPTSTTGGSYTIAVDVRTSTGVYRDAVGYLGYILN
jgi:hypothetical protein